MKNWLSKNWYKVFLVVALLIGILIASNRCSEKHIENAVETTDISVLRQYLIDSVVSVELNKKIAEIERIKAVEGKKANYYKQSANNSMNEAKKQKHISDSLQKLIPETDTVCLKTISSKQIEINTLNSVIDKKEKEIKSTEKQYFLCEQQGAYKDTLLINSINYQQRIEKANSELKKQAERSYIEKNGIVIGVAGTSILVILAKVFLFK